MILAPVKFKSLQHCVMLRPPVRCRLSRKQMVHPPRLTQTQRKNSLKGRNSGELPRHMQDPPESLLPRPLRLKRSSCWTTRRTRTPDHRPPKGRGSATISLLLHNSTTAQAYAASRSQYLLHKGLIGHQTVACQWKATVLQSCFNSFENLAFAAAWA